MDNLGTRAKARREALKLSQADVARRAGISQSTVAQIEGGRNKGSKYIVRLAAALHVSVLWLAEGKKQEKDMVSSAIDHEFNTGPLRYDVIRALLLSPQQRLAIEHILSALLHALSGAPEHRTKGPQPSTQPPPAPKPRYGKFKLSKRPPAKKTG